MKLSTSLNVFDESISIEEQIQRCSLAGFERLDLNYTDYQKQRLTETWETEEKWAHRIRTAAEQYGVRFSQMHGPVHGITFHEMYMGMNEESFLSLAVKSLRTASIIGIPWVVFHPTPISRRETFSLKETVDFNISFFNRLLPTIEETGVGIAMENLFSFASTADQLAELVDRINHPLIGACWDTGHGHIQSQDQYVAIKQLALRLKTVHVQDNDGKSDQHMLPYHGTIDWNNVMKALRETGYAGDFTYEVHNAIRKVPDNLRDVLLHYAFNLGISLQELQAQEEFI